MSFIYNECDIPTRADCDAEEFDSRVRANCRAYLLAENDWFRRASEACDRYWRGGDRRSSFVRKLIYRISDRMDSMIDDLYDDEAYEMADAAALAKDPYKYHGVSRRDFL